jgi:hypothetical protein
LKEKNEFARRFFMPMKEKPVKILAPGAGWTEMAAHCRRRNDTSRHAIGVWEEFSFLDKGSFWSKGEGACGLLRLRGGLAAPFFDLHLRESWKLAFPRTPFREGQSNHLEIFLKYPKNENAFYFRPNHLRRPGKSRHPEHHATWSYQQPLRPQIIT